jgi:hypothetical protein
MRRARFRGGPTGPRPVVQRMLSAHAAVHNTFNLRRHLEVSWLPIIPIRNTLPQSSM